jgi:hypothetical protein
MPGGPFPKIFILFEARKEKIYQFYWDIFGNFALKS